MTAGATALAQFGHPLKGTWIGEWGPNKEHVVVELKWDGNAITGTINPGANGVPLKVATFDAPKWTVHFEADGKDRGGQCGPLRHRRQSRKHRRVTRASSPARGHRVP